MSLHLTGTEYINNFLVQDLNTGFVIKKVRERKKYFEIELRMFFMRKDDAKRIEDNLYYSDTKEFKKYVIEKVEEFIASCKIYKNSTDTEKLLNVTNKREKVMIDSLVFAARHTLGEDCVVVPAFLLKACLTSSNRRKIS